MDPNQSSRNGQLQPNFGQQYTDRFGVPQFSNPWTQGQILAASVNPTSAPSGMGMSDMTSIPKTSLRQSSVASSYDPMSLGGMATTRNMSQQPLYSTDLFTPTSNAYTYAEHTSGASPTAGATGFGMNSYPSYGQKMSTSLIDYSRPGSISAAYATDEVNTANGMLRMSQNDIRFPSIPSSHRGSSSASSASYYPQSQGSSISSTSSYPYFGSVGSNETDISSISDMYDTSRPSLPRPAGMLGSISQHQHQQPGQAHMMSQFNSRPQTNSSKKHKCSTCDKRFTRPSSLQTHTYSHTGEKPFICDVQGCGRQFSVVSNLRRHRKVHKGPDGKPLPEKSRNGSVCGSVSGSIGSYDSGHSPQQYM